jgi:hypothetical protein
MRISNSVGHQEYLPSTPQQSSQFAIFFLDWRLKSTAGDFFGA